MAWTLDPMLMSDNAQLMTQEKAMAFVGILRLASTLPSHSVNGRPWLREKEKVCRQVEALKGILLKITGSRIIAISPFAPAIEVAFWKSRASFSLIVHLHLFLSLFTYVLITELAKLHASPSHLPSTG